MTKLTTPTKKLYNCIVKLVDIYESSLDELAFKDNLSHAENQKQINNALNYLAKLIMQLNKLHAHSINDTDKNDISQKDEEIINRFLAKYKDTDFKSS